jgi:transposase/IS5 family transposase
MGGEDGCQKKMRGVIKSQPELVCLISPESVVPKDHPIRTIKRYIDEALSRMNRRFDAMYAQEGRPSIPPERLLKAKVLIALFSVRSENLFIEQLHYNLLYRWFLDMDLSEPVFDNSTFSKNQERLMQHEVAKLFFGQVVKLAGEQGWVSDEHFSVDGTLIESWASLKSFVPKDQPRRGGDDEDPGNADVDFRGQKRSNATHESTTDPEARLRKKAAGQEARLSFGLHALMENRHGLYVDLQVSPAVGVTESDVALEMLRRQKRARSVGADKGYHHGPFVQGCRKRRIVPHVATARGRKIPGLDGRTTRTASYALSQKIRKRIEEGFGWMKTVGGFRKTRFKGIGRTQLCAYFVGAACNLVRMATLALGPPALAAPR